jgi:GTPase SAR1 family protein/predicted type IV restriction endonuclease
MQAPFELNVGLDRLRKIISSFPPDSPHWNEAQNRFQFVDRLLTECLGWERPQLSVEVSDDSGGKADYILGKARAVLEAKREAKSFGDLPIGKPTTVRKLQPLLTASKEFSDAVHQVLPYCAIHGAPIAIVCNGPQLAIFQALTPGFSPLEGECYFFNGFRSYIEFFPILWTLMSPEGITENRAHRDLARFRNPRVPPKASESLPEPTRYRYRNDFQENLRALSSLLLEEIEDNPALKRDFYRECYVPLEANNRHLLLSKNVIAARYRRVSGDNVAPTSFSTIAAVGKDAQEFAQEIEAIGVAGSRPIVVVGDVGVGKTSFFENLFEGLDKSNSYFIHINLGLKANLSKDVKSYVLREIPAALSRNYKIDINETRFVESIYYDELRAFDRGVAGQLKNVDEVAYLTKRVEFLSELVQRADNHLMAALGHLARGQQKQIILVMDNADQRTFAIQQEAFLIAQELAASRNLVVFVALRPSTFYLSKMTGALSGYQNKLLTISPPPADEVVQRRLTFAVRVAEGKVAPAALSHIRLELGNVVSFLQATLRSIRTSEAIRSFLSNITGGNVRAVIELISGFCGSPNVDSRKIVQIEQERGQYNVPLHEFTKHALLGEYAYFNAQSSLVACNIFDVKLADPREHFLASLVVSYLSSNVGIRDNDGYLSGTSIIDEMSRFGFLEEQIRYCMQRLAVKKLIETPHAHYRELIVPVEDPPEQFFYRATSVGVYHVRYWAGAFSFLDATSTDTPILDQDIRDFVSRNAASFDIADRYYKAEAFRRYLETCWNEANFEVTYFDFLAVLQGQDDTFASVQRFVEHGPRKRW